MSLAAYPRIADWITAQDGLLLVRTGKVDIGQRISTALIQIAHEELGVPFNRIDIATVRTDKAPDEGMTSGSNSIEQSGKAVQCAAATLRATLRKRLASKYGGAPEEWALADGAIFLPGTNHRFPVIELIENLGKDDLVDPAALPVARPYQSPPRPRMRGIAEMVRGGHAFIHDLDVPGMWHARVVRPPHVHARLNGVPETARARLAAKGLHLIEDGSFLAVVGPNEWPVVDQAQKLAIACDWDVGKGLPETDVFTLLNASKSARFHAPKAAPTKGPIPEPLVLPDHTARYERTYQLHGSLGPSAAMAQWSDGVLTLKSHSQGIYPLRESIADSLGLALEKVIIEHMPGSGCYGHTGADDAAFEAALVAMAHPDRPILLKWSREDEHMWEPFAPAMAVELAAKTSGRSITAFSAEVFSDTHRGRPRPGPKRAGPGKLLANRFRETPIGPTPAAPNMGVHAGMHRNLDPVYAIENKRLVKNLVPDLPHRTSAMRCLGAAVNIFAIESFMDTIARKSGADPIAFRLSHLDDDRARNVLLTLQDQLSHWPDLTEATGRGVAFAQYKNAMTRVAVAIELTVNDMAEIQLHRAAIVADAGRIVDAEGLTAQLEGGLVQAASWALHEEVKWDRDGIQTRDWDSYPVIRFDNIPKVSVTLQDQPDEKSLGAGEASPGPTLGAIGNAVFDAVGLRLTRLPFTAASIRQAAYH
ncbi:MAG: xanthine dehydrogenase family protein molybdopterin-binding subunit [Silicimonas sp.]|nr:xanthine dehydrogenase family protein molybdopterin-binding subunit [Silicimonas sp.]